MLISLTRKLCPLMALTTLFCGCGKKIGEPQSTEGGTTQSQEPSSSLTIELDTSDSLRKIYPITKTADFKGLPSKLIVKSGDATGATVKIYYNVDDPIADDYNYQFHCIYKSTNTAKEIPLQGCENLDGGDYGEVTDPENVFFMYRDKYIQVDVVDRKPNDFIIDARYTVDWIQRN